MFINVFVKSYKLQKYFYEIYNAINSFFNKNKTNIINLHPYQPLVVFLKINIHFFTNNTNNTHHSFIVY